MDDFGDNYYTQTIQGYNPSYIISAHRLVADRQQIVSHQIKKNGPLRKRKHPIVILVFIDHSLCANELIC